MANTYCRILIHAIWSTKNREPSIRQKIDTQLWAYLAGICAKHDSQAIRIGGIENHVHGLIELSKNITIPTIIKELKASSTKWMNQENRTQGRFAWQDGYAAFSVSPSKIAEVIAYIENQREHHRHVGFEEEYRGFMKRHELEYDEKYLLG